MSNIGVNMLRPSTGYDKQWFCLELNRIHIEKKKLLVIIYNGSRPQFLTCVIQYACYTPGWNMPIHQTLQTRHQMYKASAMVTICQRIALYRIVLCHKQATFFKFMLTKKKRFSNLESDWLVAVKNHGSQHGLDHGFLPYNPDLGFFFIMTSSNGNIFRVTDLFWRKLPATTGHRWFPSRRRVTRSFKQTVKQTIETPVIWEAIALFMTSF